MLVVTGGDYLATVLGGVNYGRDSDSIASMGGAIAGALHGPSVVPGEWADFIQARSRKDLVAVAASLAEVAREVFGRDRERFTERVSAFPAAVPRGSQVTV